MSQKLKSCENWEAQVKVAVDYIYSAAPFMSKSDLAAAAVSFYNKLVIADKYTPNEKLHSVNIRLVKASSNDPNHEDDTNDFDLNKVIRSSSSSSSSSIIILYLYIFNFKLIFYIYI